VSLETGKSKRRKRKRCYNYIKSWNVSRKATSSGHTMSGTILREIYNLAEGCEEKMETQNKATKRARAESTAQDNECHARQPEQEQHMAIGDTQASAEDSGNVDFIPLCHVS
jgi:hypothetical protein